jgi:molybdopterin molybdotransferase
VITVEAAKNIIENNVSELKESVSILTKDALGFRLAEDVFAPLDLPPFNQSNVDGYAVCGVGKQWNVITEIKAGDHTNLVLKEGEAARIFTGAMVPAGSDCVIMQERIERKENIITLADTEIKLGEHIRIKGSQIKAGELALSKGTLINPSVVGFISSMGLKEIKVFKKPSITLIITGNELQEVGTKLEQGKVYESNSSSLSVAASTMGLSVEKIIFVKDDKIKLAEVVNSVMQSTDVLLISGGISIGDYDFVNEVLQENKTETLFYKVAQKPGKPLFFGKNKNTYVFGLPGNPASALTCFYEYVYPCLRKLQVYTNIHLTKVQLPLEAAINKKKGLANFLKAKASTNSVLSLEGQESFKMRSFAEANAFIYLPLDSENKNAGELVEVHLHPNL